MVELRKKYKKTTNKDFDDAITELFDSATATVNKLGNDGLNPSCDLNFWRTPKIGTVFENVSDNTTYRFALKMLEARQRWVERQRPGTGQIVSPAFANHECQTAKAIDRFNDAVEVAALKSRGADALMNDDFSDSMDFTMKPYMMDQFDQFSDSDSDDLDDEEGPIEAYAASRVNVQNSGTTDDDVGSNLTPAIGTLTLTARGRVDEEPLPARVPEQSLPARGTVGFLQARMEQRLAEMNNKTFKDDEEWHALIARRSEEDDWELDEDMDDVDM